MKGGKEDEAGGVFCWRMGARKRRVGRTGEEVRWGRTGEEAGCMAWRECFCSAVPNICSNDSVDWFFTGDIGT